MDYEAVRAGYEQAIPFNQHVGLEMVEVGDGVGVVRLPEGDHLLNHVGSQHAGALFAAGEAASKAGINSTPSVFVDGEKVEGEGLTIADIAQRMVG